MTLRVLALLLLLISFGLLGVGCGTSGIPGIGPQVAVPDTAQKALDEGKSKEDTAQQLAAKNKTESDRLFNEAATYYAAVAKKYPGSETGLRSLMAEGRLQTRDERNYPNALNTLRSALREYTPASFAELHAQLQRQNDDLVAKMDDQNRKATIPIIGVNLYSIMDTLYHLMGGNPNYSYVLVIVFISVGITLALWPLRARQIFSMKEMQLHQPEIKKLQAKYKGEKALLNEKTMEFYKENGINPMASCLPMLLQWPVLLFLYRAVSAYQFQFARATFLWMTPSIAHASANWPWPLTGAVARNLGEQDLILLFVYAVSMYFQTKMTPATDPSQAEQQKMMAVMMPPMFFIMMLQWHLPSAFVLYWFLSNLFYVAQQWYITKTMVLPESAAAIRPSDGDGGILNNGAVLEAKPLTPNPRLVSPKNRKKR